MKRATTHRPLRATSPLRAGQAAAWAGIACAGLVGCDDPRPTHPFAHEPSAAPSTAPATASLDAPQPDATSTPRVGAKVEGEGRSLEVGGRRLLAPSGRLFRRWLATSDPASGPADVAVWQESSTGDRGELVVHFAGGGESQPLRLPSRLSLARCQREVQLLSPSPGLVALEVRASCGDHREQWLAVARLDPARREAEARLELSAADPVRYALRVEDRDHDGRPDLVLGVRHRDAADADPELPIALLDRPAGYAWDPAEPEATLARLGRALRAEREPIAAVAPARRLLELAASVCGELGGAGLVTHVGAVRCGPARGLGDALAALGRGALVDGDLARATLVAERLTELDPKAPGLTELERALATKLRLVAPSARGLAAVPRRDVEPHAPYTFDAEGKLLVVEERRVVRIDLGSLELEPTEALAWPRALAWGSGDATIELVAARRRCDALSDTLETRARGGAGETALPRLGALLERLGGGPCVARPLPVSALLVDGGRAELSVGGEPFELGWGDAGLGVRPLTRPLVGGPPGMPGSARSSDGRVVVLALPASLLVTTDAGTSRWKSDATRGLSGCVPRSDGKKVVCLAGEKLTLLTDEG